MTLIEFIVGGHISVEDTRLDIGDETYSYTYDDYGRLASLKHPEG